MAVSRNINEMLENAFIDNIWMKKSAVKGFLSLCRKLNPVSVKILYSEVFIGKDDM